MTTQRVEKTWQKQGLGGYATEAIVGTLAHYGVAVDEAGFRQRAQSSYPSGIAEEWEEGWKGTGPFASFPAHAAAELWRRWVPDQLSPEDFAEALAALMNALAMRINGEAGAPVAAAFEAFGKARARMPLAPDGSPDESFLEDSLGAFDEEAVELFDELAEALAEEGHVADAEAFAELEEFLLPARKGIASAVVRAARGERDPAIASLVALSADAGRSRDSRLLATDGLLHLEAYPEGAAAAKALLAEAETEKDYHLALDLCARLEHTYKALDDRAALAALAKDQKRLEQAHDAAHPGHRHRHG
ncbi:hypothetical protein [Simulacricoccus sp. 17bor-14]|uniref:hypothetical protein n=1 Tax=Myxococcaceae TaxID=31 RepID=UPI00188FDBEC|nr:hypothetical protein [Simulacricoccus sp. 17bor-14]